MASFRTTLITAATMVTASASLASAASPEERAAAWEFGQRSAVVSAYENPKGTLVFLEPKDQSASSEWFEAARSTGISIEIKDSKYSALVFIPNGSDIAYDQDTKTSERSIKASTVTRAGEKDRYTIVVLDNAARAACPDPKNDQSYTRVKDTKELEAKLADGKLTFDRNYSLQVGTYDETYAGDDGKIYAVTTRSATRESYIHVLDAKSYAQLNVITLKDEPDYDKGFPVVDNIGYQIQHSEKGDLRTAIEWRGAGEPNEAQKAVMQKAMFGNIQLRVLPEAEGDKIILAARLSDPQRIPMLMDNGEDTNNPGRVPKIGPCRPVAEAPAVTPPAAKR